MIRNCIVCGNEFSTKYNKLSCSDECIKIRIYDQNKIIMERYVEKHKDRLSIHSKKWKDNNKEKIKITLNKWKENNKDKLKKSNKNWRITHIDYVSKQHKKWNELHKEYGLKWELSARTVETYSIKFLNDNPECLKILQLMEKISGRVYIDIEIKNKQKQNEKH